MKKAKCKGCDIAEMALAVCEDCNERDKLRSRIAALTAERDAAQKALKEYGYHKAGCANNVQHCNRCNCGLDEAIKEQP